MSVGCVGRVCRSGVSVGCAAGVSVGCVAGVCRARGGCVAGVSVGCAAGVSGVCQRCARLRGACRRPEGTTSVPRGPRAPPPPLGRTPLLRVSSTRVAPYFAAVASPAVPRVARRRALPLFRARPSPRGLPLFRVVSASLAPGRRSSCVPGDPRCRRPLGTSSVPRGIKQTQTRVFFSPCAPHAAFMRRRRPNRTATRLQDSKFHPPAKNTPPPHGDPTHGPEWMSGVHLDDSARVLRACLASSFGRLPFPVECVVACRVVFHGLPDCASPRRRQQAPCTALPIKARCVSAVAHGQRRRPRV